MRRNAFFIGCAVWGVCAMPLALGQRARPHHRPERGGELHQEPEPPPAGRLIPETTPLGGLLPGLTAEQQAAFTAGREEFVDMETREDGLGPVYNGKSCAECHAQPTVGGASPDLDTSVVVRIGAILDGVFDPLTEYGGPVLQRRSLREDDPTYPIGGEQVPPQATLISHRITPPLFGTGLIEAIPDAEIMSRSDPDDLNRDGISGRPNLVFDPETGRTEIGRFGWKAHGPTLHLFAGDAYLNEMGITTPTFPHENLPQGQAIPDGYDAVPETDGKVEDDGEGVDKFADFMRFLSPLPRPAITTAAQRGEVLFAQIGCANCHTPAMTTGDNPIAALRNKTVRLYSDLLLHDMGPDLADGMVMGSATGSEWRTTPLWGISHRKFFLHDGRALTLSDAVVLHGGEALVARNRYVRLSRGDRELLVAFLSSL
jgi:CxxC motif-containing protein (DUF1111 family)